MRRTESSISLFASNTLLICFNHLLLLHIFYSRLSKKPKTSQTTYLGYLGSLCSWTHISQQTQHTDTFSHSTSSSNQHGMMF